MSPRERQIMRELSGSLPEQEERIARAREQARAAGASPAELHQLAEQLRADADRSRAALLDELRRERAAYGVRGHSTEHVWVANVVTLYTRIGDLFAQILLAGCGCIILLRLAHGLRIRRPGKQAVARQSVATTEDSA